MKPLPAPRVPGNTEAERMGNALRKILTVSKEDLLKGRDEMEAGAGEEETAQEVNIGVAA